MKPYLIKKSFKGTQDGQHNHHEFVAGTTAPLSPGLAAIVVKEGWAEPVKAEAPVKKAPEAVVEAVTEEKAIEAATANKAHKAAPANKKK